MSKENVNEKKKKKKKRKERKKKKKTRQNGEEGMRRTQAESEDMDWRF